MAGNSQPVTLERGLGLKEAVALNMIDMVGIGPFIVVPLVIKAMGGPQSLLAWAAGAVLALLDGFVWSALGAANVVSADLADADSGPAGDCIGSHRLFAIRHLPGAARALRSKGGFRRARGAAGGASLPADHRDRENLPAALRGSHRHVPLAHLGRRHAL